MVGRNIQSAIQFIFSRVGRIRNYNFQKEFYKNPNSVQQKVRRVLIFFRDRLDKEIDELSKQGHA